MIDEVVLFGRALREAITSGEQDALPHALTTVLMVLHRQGECRQNALAHELFVSQSFLSRQVSELADAGFVERKPDPDDGRASRIVLSERGLDYVRQVKARRIERLRDLLVTWDEEQADSAVRALRQLKDTFCEQTHRANLHLDQIGTPAT
nr:MarR family transcriptional regulator [Rhodococcus sp. HNM0569]